MDPSKQHIAYTIFHGSVCANGVEQFVVCINSSGAKSAFTSAQDPPTQTACDTEDIDTPTEGVHQKHSAHLPDRTIVKPTPPTIEKGNTHHIIFFFIRR
jgi:hypothetical protein